MKKNPLAVLLCLFACSSGTALAQQAKYPFNDPSLPTEKRIDNLLSLMTIDEKIDCLGTNTGVPRLGVMSYGSSEGIHGVVQREAQGQARADHDDAVSAAAGNGRVVGSGSGARGGRRGGVRGAVHHADGEVRPPDPDAVGAAVGPGARSAMGAQRGGLRRRSILERDDGCRLHEGTAGRRSKILASGGAAEAFPGKRERERPQQFVL